MRLRTDERGWLITATTTLRATVRALESLAMAYTGAHLSRHPDIRIRAVGSLLSRLSEARMRWGKGLVATDPEFAPTEAEQRAYTVLEKLISYLGDPTVDAEATLEEFWAACVRIDQELKRSGVAGPSPFQELARGM